MNEITFNEIQIRESLNHEFKELLCINIKYPEFNGVSDFINNFYKSLAEKSYEYARTVYFTEAVQRYEMNDDPRKRFRYKPESVFVNFKITLLNDKFISLYMDNLIYSQNKLVKSIRYSQTWSDNILFTLNSLFYRDKRFRNYSNSNFYLTEECVVLYNKSNEELRISLKELKPKLDILTAV